MYQDIESRRDDTREAAVDSVTGSSRRGSSSASRSRSWLSRRAAFPRVGPFGSPYGFGVYFRGGMGAEAIRDLLRDLDLVEES